MFGTDKLAPTCAHIVRCYDPQCVCSSQHWVQTVCVCVFSQDAPVMLKGLNKR